MFYGYIHSIFVFQSTLPVWGATFDMWGLSSWLSISIHAPRVGSDHVKLVERYKLTYFNPRSPCGERLPLNNYKAIQNDISIHAPRVGSDANIDRTYQIADNFNPRSPCGERLIKSDS